MNAKSLILLGGATLTVAVVAAMTLHSRESAVKSASDTKKLFPGLSAAINDVTSITLKKQDGEYTLQRTGEKWGLAQKSNYPVDVEPVRKALIALADMTTVEPKTTNPELYSKLGVEEADAEGSTSTLITVKDAGGTELAKLIVGKAHEGKGAMTGAGQTYVRIAGETQSWLAKGSLELKDKSADWLDKTILKVERERVKAVEVKHPGGEVVHTERAKPEDNDFTLANIPEGKELKYPTIAGSLSGGLDYLNLEDVQPADAVDFSKDPGAVCRFTCFDGLVVTVTTKDADGKTFARFEASFEAPPPEIGPVPPEEKKDGDADKDKPKKPAKKTPEEVQKDVADLNARLAPWAYVIPAYNRSTFAKKMDELVKDKAPPPPPPGSEPAVDEKDKDAMAIPGDLPPEIQEQIKKHQESLGNKTIVVPPGQKKEEPPAAKDPPPAPPVNPPEPKPPK